MQAFRMTMRALPIAVPLQVRDRERGGMAMQASQLARRSSRGLKAMGMGLSTRTFRGANQAKISGNPMFLGRFFSSIFALLTLILYHNTSIQYSHLALFVGPS